MLPLLYCRCHAYVRGMLISRCRRADADAFADAADIAIIDAVTTLMLMLIDAAV